MKVLDVAWNTPRYQLLSHNVSASVLSSSGPTDTVMMCAADVKQCPDGTFVSRCPKMHCHFKPCNATLAKPASNTTVKKAWIKYCRSKQESCAKISKCKIVDGDCQPKWELCEDLEMQDC